MLVFIKHPTVGSETRRRARDPPIVAIKHQHNLASTTQRACQQHLRGQNLLRRFAVLLIQTFILLRRCSRSHLCLKISVTANHILITGILRRQETERLFRTRIQCSINGSLKILTQRAGLLRFELPISRFPFHTSRHSWVRMMLDFHFLQILAVVFIAADSVLVAFQARLIQNARHHRSLPLYRPKMNLLRSREAVQWHQNTMVFNTTLSKKVKSKERDVDLIHFLGLFRLDEPQRILVLLTGLKFKIIRLFDRISNLEKLHHQRSTVVVSLLAKDLQHHESKRQNMRHRAKELLICHLLILSLVLDAAQGAQPISKLFETVLALPEDLKTESHLTLERGPSHHLQVLPGQQTVHKALTIQPTQRKAKRSPEDQAYLVV